jgi:cytochrome oxidase Cu insertion factor (SCO1/SenC/PrrC family)
MRRAVMAGLLLAVVGCSSPSSRRGAPPLDDFGPVADFSFTERSGRTVTRADLAGKVWVVSFVFTRCTGPCPQVTGTVARIQDALRDEPDVRLVTFTVDPRHDTPDELKEYARHFGADPERWLFLTGPEEELYRLSEKSFFLAAQRNTGKDVTPGTAVTHSPRLAVVDRRGHFRAYFDGRQVDDEGQSVDEVPKLCQAVTALLREAP